MRYLFSKQHLLVCAAVFALTAACSTSKEGATDTATAAKVADTTGSMAGMQHDTMSSMAGMAMTGDADRDFLRMILDHHSGMIAMAHEGKDKGGAAIKSVANKIDEKQDKELEDMKAMLDKEYQDKYEPKVKPEDQQMADDLKSKSGAAFDKAFTEHTIMHHEMGIKMIDEYVPKGKNAAVRQMAQKMKADQTKEIAELRQKLAKM